jgi:hypothetical protein
VLIDPVELDRDHLAPGGLEKVERLAVPSDARRQIAPGAGCGSQLIIGTLDAPIVGKVERPPVFVLKIALFRSRRLAEMETPAVVKQTKLAVFCSKDTSNCT